MPGLRQALALWRGPALADVADTDFGQAAIARLDELRLSAIEQRVDADLRTGNTASLVAELEGLVIAHPMREPLAARLMRALHAAGRRSAALEVYEQTRKRLVNQLGVEPSAELAALHLDILRDEPPAEPDPKTPRPVSPARLISNHASHKSTNLRAELTSFVGRDAELRQVAEFLGAYRLITLTGPGGAGKTRLAIELAAARLRTMAPEQIVARLGDRFGLLSSGSRTAMPRHQTLRAVVDWSWDLLDDAERALWRRFSVFTGGATLEAAEQVCSGSGLPADQVLDLLTALAEKSLLTVRHDPPRYWMLEIIRAYGAERLAEADEQEEVREAHAQYFTRLAEASQEHLLRPEQLDWLRRLSADQDNMHAAIRGAVAGGDGPTAVRLAAALGWYWSLRSMKVEGAELIGEAVSAPGSAAADPENLAVAYAMGALLAIDTPMRTTGLDWLGRAGALAARIADPVNPIMPLIGPLAALFGVPDPARGAVGPDIFDDATAYPHPWVAGIARILRGHWALNLGQRHAEAEADFLAGSRILAELGERWGQAVALGGLGMLEGWRGEHAVAVGHYRRALELTAAFGSTEDELQFRLFMVRQLWLAGEREAARAELSRALPDAERLGLPELRTFAVYVAGDLARLDGRPEAAREALVRAVQLATPPDVAQQVRAVAATGLGYLAGAEGDLVEARDWHAQALAAARSSADAPVIAEALTGLADLALRENDAERAAELLGASVAIRGTTDRSVHDEKRLADLARSVLGEARYGRAYQRGQHVTVDTLAALVNLTPGA